MHLLPNERIDYPDEQAYSPGDQRDDLINQKYIKGDVRIVTEQARYPLNTIASMVESEDYKLNPEFQRRHRWDTDKKSRLIESFIMNVPVPPIFLYEDKYSHYEVMDGLQRLTAIHDFYRDRFALSGLSEWRELNGRCYSKLPEQVKRGIDRRYLSSIILLQETAKSEEEAQRLKQLVFERLNSGGVTLEPQESRNAIYNGPLNKLCIALSRNSYLCRMWGIPEPTAEEREHDVVSEELLNNESYRKMEDVELVLRFFAYRQRLSQQKGALKNYLDHYLKVGNLKPKALLNKFKSLFENTIQLVYDTLGESAFYLYRRRKTSWSWLNRPTIALYDPLMFVFSQHIADAEQLIAKRETLKENMKLFYKSK
ncbi:MAG TPA: DUF262 domain-containing protein [Candidatus Acidoferrum sp.]|nr:DUF262 domain-containing protein [Candidatus Acidoferrum sp.]